MSTFGETVEQLECRTCGAFLRELAPGHQLRCAAAADSRRRRSIIAALVLLVLTVLLFALPAYAQSLDPTQLTDSFNTKALATIAAVQLLALGFLGRALMQSYEKRIEAQQVAFEQTIRVQVGASELAKEALGSMDILEHVAREIARRPAS